MDHIHDHGADACPLCPTEDQLAAMRARNRDERARRRDEMLAMVTADPAAWVHAIEARSEGDHDIVMHIASTIAKARAWCEARPRSEYGEGGRYHVIPHLLDADHRHSGVVSVAVYGIAEGSDMPSDLVGTDEE
jgi:hypothetical protein